MTNAPATSAASAAGPVLRGLHNATIKRNLAVSLGLTAIITVAYKVLINDPKKAAYAEFYQKYDAKKSFERMKAAGRFQSC
ncbi:GL19570 [Drosophila persimilis]|uniref:Cytochrome C oxidase subunit 6C-1 n=2 Tax=pseudoobscura subgroup TaxID=32358 RepID=A0A6I8W011_DROPS|nr:cytochrome c oxidase subunit 6C-1 [Drosophila pseudoobscura]XP_002015178.1 cytochrome c oxidase subunit 6C-1 [Drosophila persimilis]XP_022220922.1 cytochrome c oxidase subunit 6C-1 [Drosophila obscura]XP_022220923.1 cytochrome c oxidase subunit 6C-1 [Drosophila obscura]XP_033236661.1 cytochrome c oxidase subunit 6C-1 [Drosophila pseudoobscura]EDW29174.1 GL19570 [Drosophila persimilis]